MQIYNIKQNILFILVFSLVSSACYSQTKQDVLAFANKSFARNQYEVALKEYQRVLFFSENKSNPSLFQSIADCHFQVGNLERALEYYDRAYFLYEDDSLKQSMLFDKIACHVFQKNYDLAFIDMYSLPDTLSDFFEGRRHFYLAIVHFGKEEFQQAKQHFINIHPGNSSFTNQLNEWFDPKGKINRPNPKTAFILSLIIPGTGQFYAGDFKNGLNSFLLNEGLLFLGIYTAYRYTVLDAIFSVGPWFQRYYQGGLESAEKIAEQKRAMHRQEIFNKTLNLIDKVRTE